MRTIVHNSSWNCKKQLYHAFWPKKIKLEKFQIRAIVAHLEEISKRCIEFKNKISFIILAICYILLHFLELQSILNHFLFHINSSKTFIFASYEWSKISTPVGDALFWRTRYILHNTIITHPRHALYCS